MSRLSRLSRPAWLTTGLLIGAILVPTAAFAAATVVNISGGGYTAKVSPAGQLRTVEMDPANLVHGTAFSTGGCAPLAGAPANRALVIKQININADAINAPNAYSIISSSPTCATVAFFVDLPQRGVTSVPLGTGIPVRAGTGLYFETSSGTIAYADAFGYSVSPSAVPAGIAARQQIGMTPKTLARTRTR